MSGSLLNKLTVTELCHMGTWPASGLRPVAGQLLGPLQTQARSMPRPVEQEGTFHNPVGLPKERGCFCCHLQDPCLPGYGTWGAALTRLSCPATERTLPGRPVRAQTTEQALWKPQRSGEHRLNDATEKPRPSACSARWGGYYSRSHSPCLAPAFTWLGVNCQDPGNDIANTFRFVGTDGELRVQIVTETHPGESIAETEGTWDSNV